MRRDDTGKLRGIASTDDTKGELESYIRFAIDRETDPQVLKLLLQEIRNVLSDLEDLGFVKAPHTSAGRVPTIKGYRFFVDTLVKLRPPKGDELKLVQEVLQSAEPQALVQTASTLLSSMTQLAGLVTLPRRVHTALRQIEFLQLSDRRVLAILVLNDRDVYAILEASE